MTGKKRSKKAWLISRGQKLPGEGEEAFFRKFVERSPTGSLRVWRENPPVAFSQLASNDLLNTEELLRFFGCSLPTLYRWISQRGLKPTTRVGRELFFKKADVEHWNKQKGRPRPGRPKRK